VTRLTGFVPPIATPFRDGALDLKSLSRLLDHLAEHVAGYLVGGSVGEVPSLTLEERATLMRAAAGRRPAGHSLAVSISDNAIANSRVLSDLAGEVEADVLMLSCPNYFANDLPMLIEYFGAVGEFASAEICLYDNPLASHTLLSVADIKAIADAVPRVTHVKVTDTAIDKVAALREATDLVICAGDDAVLWNQFVRGIDAAMVALPMIAPEVAASMWSAYESGAMDDTFAAYARAAPFLHSSLGAADYVAVIKTVLHHRGVIESAEVRLPLVALPAARRAEVIGALAAFSVA
jgi:dihydrodipicolinate synthase/N-acetylneuraminate lyase